MKIEIKGFYIKLLKEFLPKVDSKYVLNGVLFSKDGKLVSIEWRRMIIIDLGFSLDQDIILPFGLLTGIKKKEKYTFSFNGGTVLFNNNIILNPLSGEFPNYTRFLPGGRNRESVARIKLNTDLLPKGLGGVFNFYGAGKPVKIDNIIDMKDDTTQKLPIEIVIMPMRLEQ